MTMSFCPRPLVAWYQARARSAAGFVRVCLLLVTASHNEAPLSNSSIESPWRDAGRSPTPDVADVLPPTQSHIGNVASHESFFAMLSTLLPTPFMAIAFFSNESPIFL